MLIRKIVILLAIMFLGISFVQEHNHEHHIQMQVEPLNDTLSPYVNQLDSPVKGLSTKEIDDLLNGRGMGFARVAELNNYPGPKHLLELANELSLNKSQLEAIKAVFEDMQAKAKLLGKNILELELVLSRDFSEGEIDNVNLEKQTAELARLYGELRATHLAAHLEVTPLLSDYQIRHYNFLRGYNQ